MMRNLTSWGYLVVLRKWQVLEGLFPNRGALQDRGDCQFRESVTWKIKERSWKYGTTDNVSDERPLPRPLSGSPVTSISSPGPFIGPIHQSSTSEIDSNSQQRRGRGQLRMRHAETRCPGDSSVRVLKWRSAPCNTATAAEGQHQLCFQSRWPMVVWRVSSVHAITTSSTRLQELFSLLPKTAFPWEFHVREIDKVCLYACFVLATDWVSLTIIW